MRMAFNEIFLFLLLSMEAGTEINFGSSIQINFEV